MQNSKKTPLASISLQKRPVQSLQVEQGRAPKAALDAIEAYFFALPPDYEKTV